MSLFWFILDHAWCCSTFSPGSCTQGSLLEGIRGLFGVSWVRTQSVTCKASSLLAVLSLAPNIWSSFIKQICPFKGEKERSIIQTDRIQVGVESKLFEGWKDMKTHLKLLMFSTLLLVLWKSFVTQSPLYCCCLYIYYTISLFWDFALAFTNLLTCKKLMILNKYSLLLLKKKKEFPVSAPKRKWDLRCSGFVLFCWESPQLSSNTPTS